VGQNHLLQMVALVAMEQPKSLTCSSVRQKRADVIRSLKSDVKKLVRGQYKGYLEEEGVAKDSTTETFFSVTAYMKNRRWKGVPFRLVSGKALDTSKVEIIVNFKDMTKGSFMPEEYERQECNKITISIQPEEQISILFWVKVPGFENHIEPKELSFSYHDSQSEHIDAYEKVLFDCIAGDQTSFISTDEIMSSWKFIMSVKEKLEKVPLCTYDQGSRGEDIICNKT